MKVTTPIGLGLLVTLAGCSLPVVTEQTDQYARTCETPDCASALPALPASAAEADDIAFKAEDYRNCYSDCIKIFGLDVYCEEHCHKVSGAW